MTNCFSVSAKVGIGEGCRFTLALFADRSDSASGDKFHGIPLINSSD
jgi:hypothetical protein